MTRALPPLPARQMRELFVRNLDQAALLARRVLGDREAAEDAVQEACLRCLRQPPERRSAREVDGYFLRTVYRAAVDASRSERARRTREESYADAERSAPRPLDESAAAGEIARAAHRQMEQLEPEVRAAVSLCCEQGFTLQEAAGILGVPLSTVQSRVRRGLRDLRERLAAAGYAGLAAAALAGALGSAGVPQASAALAAKLAALAGGAKTGAGAGAGAAATAAAKGGAAAKLVAGILLAGAVAGTVAVAPGLLGGGSRAPAHPGERPLLGFERSQAEELDRKLAGFTFAGLEFLPGGDYRFFTGDRLPSHFNPRTVLGKGTHMAKAGVQPWACVQEESSEGRLSLRVPNRVDPQGLNLLYCTPLASVDRVWLESPAANLGLPVLLQTSGWFRTAFPRDWSSHDLFRADVLVRGPYPGTVVVELEDDLVEPPVSRTYGPIPPGGWVTLQLDLREAAQERALDLANMRNLFLLFDGREHVRSARSEPGLDERVYLDNLRLCLRGVPAAHPVLEGEPSAYVRQLPRAYAVDRDWTAPRQAGGFLHVVPVDPAMPRPVGPPAAPPPLEKLSSLAIDLEKMLAANVDAARVGEARDMCRKKVQLQAVAAHDADHMLVCFSVVGEARSGNGLKLNKGRPWDAMLGNSVLSPVCGAATTDGGATWKGADSSEGPALLSVRYKTGAHKVHDAGADLMGISDFGSHAMGVSTLSGLGYPGDRTFFWRTVFTGEKWWISPRYFVSTEPRDSTAGETGQVLQTAAGRLWAVWYGPNRNVQPGEGPDYRHGGEPKDRGPKRSVWARLSDDGGVTWQSWRGPGLSAEIPVYGRLVRCRDRVAVVGWKELIRFDGKEWSAPQPVNKRHTGAAVGWGEEVYLVGRDGSSLRFDGARWQSEGLPGGGEEAFAWEDARLSLCGGRALLCIAPDKDKRKLFVWRKTKGAAWAGPDQVASEGTAIADLVAPRHAPEGFAPVAYNCRAGGAFEDGYFEDRNLLPWIKLLKVPAR